jgi:hypothetical protein
VFVERELTRAFAGFVAGIRIDVKIIALLDKGGMGEVYRGGRDTNLKREVADPSDYDSGYGTGARASLAAWSRNISM